MAAELLAFSHASVSSIIFSAAIPAAAETGFALKVPGCPIFSRPWAAAISKSRSSKISLRPATAPPGSPPASIFARVVRSGLILKACCAPPGEQRKPVTTSSKIKITFCSSVNFRTD